VSTLGTLTERPLSLFGADFSELYARHLCRHSQLGINVNHLIAVAGTWLGIYGCARGLLVYAAMPPWILFVPAVAYLALIALNVPMRVLAVTALFVGAVVAAIVIVPDDVPGWAFLLLILLVPACYKFQAWGHKVWTVERDMTEFNRKYPKGQLLFVVLTVYEAAILLNYLAFDRKRWQ
jgi:hypothetical protein